MQVKTLIEKKINLHELFNGIYTCVFSSIFYLKISKKFKVGPNILTHK